jgi:protein gp37
MKTTKIEWTDKTWNPITGCTKVSAGCQNCYAETMALRLKAMNQEKYKNGFIVTTHDQCIGEPYKWNTPHNIFICSMSDLFHEKVSNDFLDKIFEVIKYTPQHNYQILTKRAKRMSEYLSSKEVPQNVWLGVTVDVSSSKSRIDYLRTIPARVKFLSCEPLLEDLGRIDLTNINWVIVGGESGFKARPMKPEWLISIKTQTEEQGAMFFFKQWGTWGSDGVKRNKKANGKLIDGKVYQDMPTI